jgi:hypothetical protein
MAPRKTVNVPLLVLNFALVPGLLAVVWFASLYFHGRVDAVTLRESSFLTVEWRLMQELKAQTERQLREKDLQIAELHRRYEELKGADQSDDLLDRLEAEMARVETERRELLAARTRAAVPAAAGALPPARPQPAADAAAENLRAGQDLLRQRVAQLESELAAAAARAKAAEREAAALRLAASAGSEAPVPDQESAALRLRLERAERDLAELRAGEGGLVAAILEELELTRSGLVAREPARLDDIKTRALLRAIVRTPAIRAQYPDLLESLDRYLEAYGSQARIEGRREAYDAALETIRTLSGR